MVYVVTHQSPVYRQMSIEELLFAEVIKADRCIRPGGPDTLTNVYQKTPQKFKEMVSERSLVTALHDFNQRFGHLRSVPRGSLYEHFTIPKRTRGWRPIDAPVPELEVALRELKLMFERKFLALYHTCAFAYVKGRSVVTNAKRHQQNESKWYFKSDFHGFFPSTTLDFVMSMLSMIFPFNLVCRTKEGQDELEKALELGFLNGGLPQGTPLSPMLTNLMMIPFDHFISKSLREMEVPGTDGNPHSSDFVYTRYADDIFISSKYKFPQHIASDLIKSAIEKFQCPFSINEGKTHFGSNTACSANWMCGVMINKENQITVGHKKLKQFKSAVYNYCAARASNTPWCVEDVRELNGLYSYYKMVEPEHMKKIMDAYSNKFGYDVLKAIRKDTGGSAA